MTVYIVTRADAAKDEKPRLVEARNKTAAIAHVARTSFGAEPVSTKQAMAWALQGVTLEEVGVEAPTEGDAGEE